MDLATMLEEKEREYTQLLQAQQRLQDELQRCIFAAHRAAGAIEALRQVAAPSDEPLTLDLEPAPVVKPQQNSRGKAHGVAG